MIDFVKRYKVQIAVIFVIIGLIFLGVNFNTSWEAFFVNIIPEIIGILITYLIIEWFLSKKEEKRTSPFKERLYDKIGNAMYVFLYSIAGIETPETFGRNMNDILKEGKEQLEEILEDGLTIFSEDILNNLRSLCNNFDTYFQYLMLGAPTKMQYEILLDICNDSSKIIKTINKTYLNDINFEAIKRLNYEIAIEETKNSSY